MQTIPLMVEEAAIRGATHKIVVKPADLTEATANTEQVLTLFTAGAGRTVQLVGHEGTPFKDASDAAFNSNTLEVGETGNDDLFMTATQFNENGTEVVRSRGMTPALITAATVATADGSDAGTTQTLANALKAEINKVITDLNSIRNQGQAKYYAAATAITLTVGSMADKSLSDIDTGELVLYFRIY